MAPRRLIFLSWLMFCGTAAARWWGAEDGTYYYSASAFRGAEEEKEALRAKLVADPIITSLAGVYEVRSFPPPDSPAYPETPAPRGGILGVSLRDRAPAAEAGRPPGGKGAFVKAVARNMPADKAGIRAGDVICDINGQSVNEAADVVAKLGELTPGERVQVAIWRSGELKRFELVLAGLSDTPRQYEIRWIQGTIRSKNDPDLQLKCGSLYIEPLGGAVRRTYVDYLGPIHIPNRTSGGTTFAERMIRTQDVEGHVRGICNPLPWEPDAADPPPGDEWANPLPTLIASRGLKGIRLGSLFKKGDCFLIVKNGERILAHARPIAPINEIEIDGKRYYPKPLSSRPHPHTKAAYLLFFEVHVDSEGNATRVDIVGRPNLPESTVRKYFSGDPFDLKYSYNSYVFSDYRTINGVPFPMCTEHREDERVASSWNRKEEEQAGRDRLSEAEEAIRHCTLGEHWTTARLARFDPSTVRVNDLDVRDFFLDFPPGSIIETPQSGAEHMVGASGQTLQAVVNNAPGLDEEQRRMALLYAMFPLLQLDGLCMHVPLDCPIAMIRWSQPPQIPPQPRIQEEQEEETARSVRSVNLIPILSLASAGISVLAIAALVVVKLRG